MAKFRKEGKKMTHNQISQMIREGFGMIHIVKAYRARTGCGLKEANPHLPTAPVPVDSTHVRLVRAHPGPGCSGVSAP